MKHNIYIHLQLLTSALVLTFVLSSCSAIGLGGGDFNLITLEEEWQLGAQLEQEIANELTLVNDAATVAFINDIGQRLVNQTEMANLPWEFHVVADPSINAFNIPGGHVYVHTGLIQQVDDVSELAGVMAHEVAHGVERHATERLTAAYGLQIGAGILLGQDPGLVQQIVASIAAQGAIASFSRSDEREADQLAVDYLYRSRYDPQGMVTLFNRLLDEGGRRPGSVERFFSTHPMTEDRIRETERQIAQLPPRSDLISYDPQLAAVQARVERY